MTSTDTNGPRQQDPPTPDQIRTEAASAHRAIEILRQAHQQDNITPGQQDIAHPALSAAYRECQLLAQRLGAVPDNGENPPPWFLLATRNLGHSPHSPDVAVLLAATIAASTARNPPNGTRYSSDGSIAITWDLHHLRLDLTVEPTQLPTFELRRADGTPIRGYVHRHADMLRAVLNETRAETRS